MHLYLSNVLPQGKVSRRLQYPLCCFMLVFIILGVSSGYESGQGYLEQDREEESEGQVSAELEKQLRSASSVTELVDIFYPEYMRIHACLERRSRAAQSRLRTDDGAEWKEAAAFMIWDKEDLKNIELEWEKTQCKPREVCLDVGKELGPATNTFYKPPCVSVHRCGGCCNNEGLQCVNVSTSFVSKTLMEIKLPNAQMPRPATISFLNHTACRCQHKPGSLGPSHSIIRRSLTVSQAGCSLANKTCPHGLTWDPSYCDCLTESEIFGSAPSSQGDTDDEICGPRMRFDEETCGCVCANGLSTSNCGPNQRLDESTCGCVCERELPGEACGEHQHWDQATCQCACTRTCPKSQPLNPDTCTCQCNESLSSCFLKGKRFDPQTCRCYRLPCRTQSKQCKAGLYFSHYVCSCLPLYMKQYQIED